MSFDISPDGRFEIEHDLETEFYTLKDKDEGLIIMIRKEQLEQLIKKYCEVEGRLLL
jgi:hypothetical protein